MKTDDQFLLAVLSYVDRYGTILHKDSTPMSASLQMEYDSQDLKAEMSAYSHAMGNGSCQATILFNGELVYKAKASFTATPYHTKVEKYIPGEWEKIMGLE